MAGNALADEATHMVCFASLTPISVAQASHAIYHQNSNSLQLQFGISREAIHHIVKTCPTCPQFFPLMESILGVCSPMICGKWMLHIFLILEN